MKPINLIEHPEGGSFREIFRSTDQIRTKDDRVRSALTHIYFSLKPGELSRFHRIASDEIWNLYQGTGLKLYTWEGTESSPRCVTLSADKNQYCYVVKGWTWQAAEPLDGGVLLGCSVAPGFEFSDFCLLEENSEDAQRLLSVAPDMNRFIKKK